MERNYDKPFFSPHGHNAKEGNRESLNKNFPQRTPIVLHDGPQTNLTSSLKDFALLQYLTLDFSNDQRVHRIRCKISHIQYLQISFGQPLAQ